jgi:hypothetical protein
MIRGESSPPETSGADLSRSIEGSIAQASVMWLLHRRLVIARNRDQSLEQQIVQFSSAVFDAIKTSDLMLRNVGQARLWLIYFKGLLAAKTHPPEQMLRAFRSIAGSGLGGFPTLVQESGKNEKPAPGLVSDNDAKALEQIARGLGQKP